MSTTAAPPTHTSGFRLPPAPPVATGFEGYGDGDEPIHRLLRRQVELLIRQVEHAQIWELPNLLEWVNARRNAIMRELSVQRLVDTDALPPLSMQAFGLEFSDSDEDVTRTYLSLLNRLDECTARIRLAMGSQYIESPESDNLMGPPPSDN